MSEKGVGKRTGEKFGKDIALILFMTTILITSLFMPNTAQSERMINKKVAPEGWSEDIPISSLDGHWSGYPDITVLDDNVHVVWSDAKDPGDYNTEIYYRKSPDKGRNWEDPVRLTYSSETGPSDGWSDEPQIALNNATIHIVWFDTRNAYETGAGELYYKCSTDNGNNWSDDVPLTSADGHDSYDPSMAVDGSNIHVVWKDERSGGEYGGLDIYYKRSTDGGVTWDDGQGNTNQDRRLTFNTDTWSDMPKIAVNNNTIHVLWCDKDSGTYEAYYIRSMDNGNTWSKPVNITPLDGIKSGVWDVAVEGEILYAVGQDERWEGLIPYDSLWFIKSEDGGEHWSEKTILVPEQGADVIVSSATIAINDSHLYLAWMDGRDGDIGEIYYKYSNNSGNSWTTDLRLTHASNGSASPHITWEKIVCILFGMIIDTKTILKSSTNAPQILIIRQKKLVGILLKT